MTQKEERIATAIATVIVAIAAAILVIPITIICTPGEIEITWIEGVIIGLSCLYAGYGIVTSKK